MGRRARCSAELVGDGPRDRDPADRRLGLGRTEGHVAADLGERLDDLDLPLGQIEPGHPESGGLAPAQPAVGEEEDQRAVAGIDGVGKAGDL